MEAQGNCPPFARDTPMCLMQQNWTIWTMTILRGSSFPLNGECTTTKKKGSSAPVACWAFCGLCQSDIDCNLTPGHDTEQRDSKHKMILNPSSSARLGHTHHETHNMSV